MHANLYAWTMESNAEGLRKKGDASRFGIRDRYFARCAFRLLDCPGALVTKRMNYAEGIVVSHMTDAVHSSRNTVGHSDAAAAAPAQSNDPIFSALFDSSGEALLVLDSAGTIQRANGRARELLRLKE